MIQIILGFLVICLIIGVVSGAIAKTKVNLLMKSKPKAAMESAKDSWYNNSLTKEEYVKQLEKIANQTGYPAAMRELAKFYEKEHETTIDQMKKRDIEDKIKFWKSRAAKAGDMITISEYYGFSDYDVASDLYEDIIRDLDAARAIMTTDEQRAFVDYYKGLTNYKMGRFDAARRLFSSISYPEITDNSNYMTFKCLLEEGNIPAAEKVLETLEGHKFTLSAADYLTLYNAYAAKRSSGKPDYEAEARYADKYFACKDADIQTAYRIGGDTYYTIAVGFENGSNEFPKDPDESLKAYEKAAQYENAEALYYLGEGHWSGRLVRNYNMANHYLAKAAQKGHVRAREILQRYGVDGVLVRLKDVEARSYRFLDGYELTATRNTVQWLQLNQGVNYKGNLIANEFSKQYSSKFKTFDQLVNGVQQLYADHIAQMINWGLALLLSFGIDTYDAASILEECADLSLLPRVPKFEQGLERIDARARKLNIQLNYAKATRGAWTGVGFGTTIKGTIASATKASLAAGAMNIGSGILHGIGDSIVKAMNNSEIDGMGKALFEAPGTKKEFVSAVHSACYAVGDVVVKFVESKSGICPEALGRGISYEGENLANIDDRTLKAKISNNLAAGNHKYAYALLVEDLRRFPFNDETMRQIIALTIQRNGSFVGEEYDSILRYACDFQVDVKDVADSILAFVHKNG